MIQRAALVFSRYIAVSSFFLFFYAWFSLLFPKMTPPYNQFISPPLFIPTGKVEVEAEVEGEGEEIANNSIKAHHTISNIIISLSRSQQNKEKSLPFLLFLFFLIAKSLLGPTHSRQDATTSMSAEGNVVHFA